ncbi:MAG: MFS transporter [Nanoarchaeota archaeon]
MPEDLVERIESDINNYNSLENLREKFIKDGYLEKDIDEAIFRITKKSKGTIRLSRAVKVFSWKEVLDRIGYGFVTHQFINILLYMIGAGYFLIGLLNGLRSLLSLLISSFLQEYTKLHDLSKGFISKSGILFGFSFLLMAAAIKMKLLWLFSASLLIGAIGVVTYGNFYNKIIHETIKKEKMTHFLIRISYYGVLITMVAFLVSAFLLDKFPMDGPLISIFGARYPVYGYLLSFEISAFAFILSGYFINFLDYRPQEKKYRLSKFLVTFLKKIGEEMGVFKKRLVFLLLVLSIMISATQLLGNSYYGIFIYRNFDNVGFGGFMNVAIIFSVALLVSFAGPILTKKIERAIGVTPMIVFGSLLMAFMPFTLAYNPGLIAIGVANAISVMGAVIVGVAMSLLAKRLMTDEERKKYYSAMSIASILPLLILITGGAYLAQSYGLTTFFIGISIAIAFIVMPIAFALVYLSNAKV